MAVSQNPWGPFIPNERPINGTYSIDPAVFEDADDADSNGDSHHYYMYFGGIWGGQLQQWGVDNKYYTGNNKYPKPSEPHIPPRVARLSNDMQQLAEEARPITILLDDEHGPRIIRYGNQDQRFFEAPWVHKYNGYYYFSYSTGTTHQIAYAIGDSPYGPFRYRGILLKPVSGWTTHHSVVQYHGQWYLFYHDCQLSHGITHLRPTEVAQWLLGEPERRKLR